MIKLWNKIPSFLKSKYSFTLVLLLIWLTFFDQNNLLYQYKWRSELKKLEDDRDYYLDEIKQNKADLNALMTNPKNLEKFAREKYLMKRDNEDVFVIVEKD